jgi:hypothetical protein
MLRVLSFSGPMEYPVDFMQVYLILGCRACCDVVIGICVYHIGYSIGTAFKPLRLYACTSPPTHGSEWTE